jgi:hypothetical protein
VYLSSRHFVFIAKSAKLGEKKSNVPFYRPDHFDAILPLK